MLFYMYVGVRSDSRQEHLWFNEAMSELAGTFFSVPGVEITDYNLLHAATNNYTHPITGNYGDFLVFNGSAKSYSMAKLFGMWLYKTCGGEFISTVYENFTKQTDDELRELYFRFMENFAADGGKIHNVHDDPIQSIKLYKDMDPINNLWAIRPVIGLDGGRVFLERNLTASNTINSHGAFFNLSTAYNRQPVPVLESGGRVSLSGIGSIAATYEKFYKLTGKDSICESIIHIKVPDSVDSADSTHYYIAIVNELLTKTDDYMFLSGAYGADIFKLTPGEINRIRSGGRAAYLFVATFRQNVDTVVTYSRTMNGDVDGDGEVTISDVLEILKSLAGLPNTVEYRVDISDVLEILKFLAGLPSLIDV
jgi:hypothetical protein